MSKNIKLGDTYGNNTSFYTENFDYPKNKTIHELFEAHVKRTPNNIAVQYEDKKLTYLELNNKANQVAQALIEKGAKPNTVVGIMVEKSLELIIGILGILKSGAAYMPIDSQYPEQRINYMITDCKVSIMLIDKETTLKQQLGCHILNINNDSIYSKTTNNVQNISSPYNLMYVIYTSGSTGNPKGVMINHYSFINLINWFISEFSISSSDKNLLVSSIGFDLAQKNIYATLLKGGQLHLCKALPYNCDYLSEYIYRNKITMINCTPSAFYLFEECNADTDYYRLSSLRYVFLGGEYIKLNRLSNWLRKTENKCELINTYGPTECTDVVSSYRVKKEDYDTLTSVPIGRPIYNTRLYVLSDDHIELPTNSIGELYIGGEALGLGYYNNEQLTNEKFLFVNHLLDKKIYKTGDLARRLSDGNIELLGRMDNQVKIRGYRIELGEVEKAVLEYSGIKDTVVVAKDRHDESKYLCAYLIMEGKPFITDIKAFLSHKLPSYMIPNSYIKIEKFPLTSNGKVDRTFLSKQVVGEEIEYDVCCTNHIESDENSVEYKVRCIYKDCVENGILLDNLGVEDDLSELNVDSLIFMKIVLSIEAEFNFEFDYDYLDMNNFMMLKNIISYINEKTCS